METVPSVSGTVGLKVPDLQKMFAPDLSDTDVVRVLTEQGFVKGRATISGIQTRCWFKGDKKDVTRLQSVDTRY